MDNRTIELIDDLVTYLVEKKYKENTYILQQNKDYIFSEDAQDDYGNIFATIEETIGLFDLLNHKKSNKFDDFNEYLKQGGRDWD